MSKPPKYSKRVREEAALICAIAASTPLYAQAYSAVAQDIGGRVDYGDAGALALALAAWYRCDQDPRVGYGDCDAEAESLIRTGWTP
jgi:hypothetical protein